MFPRLVARAVQLVRKRFPKHVFHQRRFAGTGNAGEANEFSKRNIDVDILQVVLGRALNTNRALIFRTSVARHGDLQIAVEVFDGERILVGGALHEHVGH